MNCFCDRAYTPVSGVGQWNWGSFAQDVVKAGLQIGTTYAAGELGGGSGGTGTGINTSLPYYPQQQPVIVQQPSTQDKTPDWIWPALIGGGVLLAIVVIKLR